MDKNKLRREYGNGSLKTIRNDIRVYTVEYVEWLEDRLVKLCNLQNVNASTLKICSGCGKLNIEPLGLNKHGEPFLGCCPDNRYIPIKEYWKDSKYLR